ncbi:MAG: 2-amino-4-hydroxy-6-hydroxymethyldihydropteridine diphosphokinase [Nannocystaceae bacterium]|nr:2-amino-4-hydroxy-6-hydroxymethyldihydropteridine diphosphokinase [bacterium]
MPAQAYVALGGNIGDRLATLRSAVRALHATDEVAVLRSSGIYETTPVGPSKEPFLNAAVEVSTALGPPELLEQLHRIERAHGRERRVRWDARTLDLDLLLYLEAEDAAPRVTHDGHCRLPHPAMLERDFVLVPMVDLAPTLVLDGASLAQHLAALPETDRTVLARLEVDPLAPPR